MIYFCEWFNTPLTDRTCIPVNTDELAAMMVPFVRTPYIARQGQNMLLNLAPDRIIEICCLFIASKNVCVMTLHNMKIALPRSAQNRKGNGVNRYIGYIVPQYFDRN